MLWLRPGIVGVGQLPVVVAARLLPYRYGQVFAFCNHDSVGIPGLTLRSSGARRTVGWFLQNPWPRPLNLVVRHFLKL